MLVFPPLPTPPRSSAPDCILQVTRRSPEPDSPICLHSPGPLLILRPHAQAKDSESVYLIASPSASSTAGYPTHILMWAGVRWPAQFDIQHQAANQRPACQVGTRLSHKAGKVEGLVASSLLGILELGPEAKAAC